MSATIHIRNHHEALDENYVLLLTSNKVERAAVNKVLQNVCDADVARNTRGCNIGQLGRRLALHVTGDSGISKELSVGRIATSLLSDPQFPKPILVLLVGFCWGNPKLANVGSVVVSAQVSSLNEVRETPTGTERVDRPCVSNLETTREFFQALEIHLGRSGITVLTGPLGSLETLYQSTERRDQLIKDFPDLLGAEMEAFGFLPISLPWLIVKTVSDLGDNEFHRGRQPDAARDAAEAVLQLVVMLSDDELIPKPKTGAPQVLITDIITGDALRVEARELAANELNDLLNDRIGGPLVRKLGRYVSAIEYDHEFPSLMCALVLEVMQNALKHGKANHVTATLYPTKIVIEDDGKIFDPATLSGTNGGARDWRTVQGRYLDQGEIIYAAAQSKAGQGNRYTFNLSKASVVLRDARQNCSVQIAPRTIGADYGNPEVLKFDETCKVLYFYAENLRMTSRRISVANCIRSAVQGGRKVYVGCPNEREALFFREVLKDIPEEDLVVFVDAPENGVGMPL